MEISMRESIMKIKKVARVLTFLQRVIFIKVNFKMTSEMGLEY